jgi:hypothetical protein
MRICISYMSAAAVFDIHIDRKAVDAVKPRSSTRGREPALSSNPSATRRCTPHFSTAVANRQAPETNNACPLATDKTGV